MTTVRQFPIEAWARVVVTSLAVVVLGACAGQGPVGSGGGVVLELGEGQRARVVGTDLGVDLVQVRSLTAQGCLGGPVGCRDSAELVVTRGQESRTVVLYVPRNRLETEQGVNQARLFGYVVRLVALQGGARARVRVEPWSG